MIELHDVRRAISATGVLQAFNEAGVLAAADVHVARTLGTLTRTTDEDVLLAAALAVRGPRLGHVRVDLATIRQTAAVDADETVDVGALPWPEPRAWVAAVERSALVGDEPDRPLRLEGTALYLDRYWREERQVADDLTGLAGPAGAVDEALLAEGLARLGTDARQQEAAATAVRRRFAVVAGGPGTGKTTTVAQVVALLGEQAERRGEPLPLVALAAPTGKAAARLQEAVRTAAPQLATSDAVREHLQDLEARTLHRLLGWRPGSHSRFGHHRTNRLPHDVVLVDETSMVSLSLMARLVEAIRPGARLVLVGDPDQLTSIEAGVVLGDLVASEALAGEVVGLDRVHRHGEAIAAVARAIRAGDGDGVITALRQGADAVRWLDADAAASAEATDALQADVVRAARAVVDAATAGEPRRALAALTAFRLLCAHRRGPHGVATWTDRIETWLAQEVEGFAADRAFYVGRPLLVTENDHGLRLYNGDTGVVVAGEDGEPRAAFDRGGEPVVLAPGRLEAVDSAYAMTVHKSQGSQFGTAAVLLPPPTSPLLTRELLYTAVTRAQERLVVVGTEDAVRAAVARPAARASGLRERLRG